MLDQRKVPKGAHAFIFVLRLEASSNGFVPKPRMKSDTQRVNIHVTQSNNCYFDVRQGTGLSLHMAADQGDGHALLFWGEQSYRLLATHISWYPIFTNCYQPGPLEKAMLRASAICWTCRRRTFQFHSISSSFQDAISSMKPFNQWLLASPANDIFPWAPPEAAVWPLQRRHPQALHGSRGRLRWSFTQKRLHANTFTHKNFLHTHKLLQIDTFTHRDFYTQALLHTITFTHTNTFTHKHLYTETLVHTNPFSCQRITPAHDQS